MKSQINIMRQLQELVLTRDEILEKYGDANIGKLNADIESLRQKLQPNVRAIYERLYARGHVVLVASSNGTCSACRMQIPIAQDQQVRLGQHIVTCASCGRILFHDDGETPKNVTEKDDKEEIKDGIARFSAEELMLPELSSSTREGAIEELATLMEANGFIDNADFLVTGTTQREMICSTALGGGIAFPHMRGVEGGALTFAVGVCRTGLEWGNDNVKVVILSAIPMAASAFYLRLISNLAKSLQRPGAMDTLFEAKTQEEMWKTLIKLTRSYVK